MAQAAVPRAQSTTITLANPGVVSLNLLNTTPPNRIPSRPAIMNTIPVIYNVMLQNNSLMINVRSSVGLNIKMVDGHKEQLLLV